MVKRANPRTMEHHLSPANPNPRRKRRVLDYPAKLNHLYLQIFKKSLPFQRTIFANKIIPQPISQPYLLALNSYS
jgi:hypothetical protein